MLEIETKGGPVPVLLIERGLSTLDFKREKVHARSSQGSPIATYVIVQEGRYRRPMLQMYSTVPKCYLGKRHLSILNYRPSYPNSIKPQVTAI